MPILPDQLPPEARRLTGRYEILAELGRGGMAVVYLARDRQSGQHVAIKLIATRYSADQEALRRFAREARTVAGLRHPNLVRTLGVEALDETGDAFAIVNAYVHGRTLRAILREAGPLRFDVVIGVLRDVAAGLAHAHAARIVHRDVKPENIFLEDGSDRALLADFGIARSLDTDTLLTMTGSSLGTPTYMAPEQVDGRTADERADVYALGLVGWEMVAGRRPWQGETLYTVLHNQKHERLPDLAALRPDIPAFLLSAIEGAMQKDPAARWRDAGELLARLTPRATPLPPAPSTAEIDATTLRRVVPVSAGEAPPIAPAPATAPAAVDPPLRQTPPVRATRRGVRRPVLLATGAVAVMLVLLLALVSSRRSDDGIDPTIATSAPSVAPAPPVARDTALDSLLAASARTANSAAGDVRLDSGRAAVPNAPPAAPESPRPSTPSAPGVARTLAETCQSPASADQRSCLLGHLERTDARLTRVYQGVIARYRRAAGGVREPASVRALRAEQRAWLATRDRVCRERTRATEGPLWAAARVPCFEQLAEQRAAALEARATPRASAPRASAPRRRVGTGESGY
ncbi:protein kinase domain-containing protein [Roseisolibacter agri]|uniref:Protein kinase domain-containing protein n=1 Tax=Roseisolibacter agri TaxID=2014610 RepID=A0AA37V2M9_9BACT|nr:protein kinase [Roseisolibacter agri]GLC25482.1 hypothetical protein rosag_19950 [Roseisolibacter agri]